MSQHSSKEFLSSLMFVFGTETFLLKLHVAANYIVCELKLFKLNNLPMAEFLRQDLDKSGLSMFVLQFEKQPAASIFSWYWRPHHP